MRQSSFILTAYAHISHICEQGKGILSVNNRKHALMKEAKTQQIKIIKINNNWQPLIPSNCFEATISYMYLVFINTSLTYYNALYQHDTSKMKDKKWIFKTKISLRLVMNKKYWIELNIIFSNISFSKPCIPCTPNMIQDMYYFITDHTLNALDKI